MNCKSTLKSTLTHTPSEGGGPGKDAADAKETIDFTDEKRNMYGCAPCPNCGSVYRYGRTVRGEHRIDCDDCGYIAPATIVDY